MTSITTNRYPEVDGAVEVAVFAGPDSEHCALAGVLTFRRGEDQEFIRRVEDFYQDFDPTECGHEILVDHPESDQAECAICGEWGV